MSIPQFESEITKIKAYKLVHDPTSLLSLLFLKYGDIENDYYISYSNQVIFNLLSHFNIKYKDYLYNTYEEFLKKYYFLNETKRRMIKLSEYYNNYFLFFSKPIFINLFYNKMICHYHDKKAEVFYNNNYSQKKTIILCKNKNKEKNKNEIDSYLSSIDNDTENDVIFNKRIRKLIDNDLNSKSCTITLDINTKDDLNYINKKSISNSLSNIVDYFIKYDNAKENAKNKNLQKNKNTKEGNINNNNYIINNKIKNINDNKFISTKDEEKNIYQNNNRNKFINLLDIKNNEKIIYKNNNLINNKNFKKIEKGNDIIRQKEKTNKFNLQMKNLQMKFIYNEKTKSNENEFEKIQNNLKELSNRNFINKKQIIFHNIYNKKELKIKDNEKCYKKIFSKKILSIGQNLNLFKSPLNKIQNIKFYSPKNNKLNKNAINKLINSINNKNNTIYNKNKLNKEKTVSNLSDIIINKGFISINVDNSEKRIYNKKYILLSRNKNSFQRIKTNKKSKQNNLNIFIKKNLRITSPRNKRNKSSENINDLNYYNSNGSNVNLSGEQFFHKTGNFLIGNSIKKNKINNLQNTLFKKLSPPSFSINKEKDSTNHDINSKLEAKTMINKIFDKKCIKMPKGKYLVEEFNKNKIIGDSNANNNNISSKKIFYPINIKKCFSKKDILKNKDIKLGLNL